MRVIHPTRKELEDRRRRLIERAGVSSRRELAERARRGTLSGEELWLWEDVKSIDFLLAEDPDAAAAVDGGG